MKRAFRAASVALVTACQGVPTAAPRGQIVLYVDTDSPVVSSDGVVPAVDRTQPLFDHVRFDVTPSQAGEACGDCTNDFAVDADAFTSDAVSVGVAPPAGESGWSVRVRLYKLTFVGSDGQPEPISALDATFALPAVSADGIARLAATLSTSGVGQSLGTGTPLETTPWTPGASRVGTWRGAARTPCSSGPPVGMVCVPGGAFWMGDVAGDAPTGTSPGWHRLVVLSPFFLDAAEMTVRAARSLGGGASGIGPWTGQTTGDDPSDWCTFTAAPGPRDALPVSCVEQPTARALCQAAGGDLPSEAQLEYVMGGLRDQPFVWGTDPPACIDAVWGRNGGGSANATGEPEVCLPSSVALGSIGGPEAAGWGKADRLVLPTGTLLDLNGNLGEWTLDLYQDQTESFWVGAGALVDPVCKQAGAQGMLVTTRGGSWGDGGTELEAPRRTPTGPGYTYGDVGLRCARPGI